MAGAGWHDFVPGEVLTAANVQDYLQDQTVMKFASAAARAAALPSPSQGMMSFLNDTGVVETYYAAYNVSTNPGGKAAGAGWYATDRNDGLVVIVPPTIVKSGGSAEVNSLGEVSFSGVSSISLNSVFTSAYKNYRIIFDGSTGAGVAMHCRLRATSDNSTANYYTALYRVDSSGGSAVYTLSAQTYFNIGQGTTSWNTRAIMDVTSPQVAAETRINSQVAGHTGTASASFAGALGFNGTTQFDGITFYPASGTTTGTVQVFGYNS